MIMGVSAINVPVQPKPTLGLVQLHFANVHLLSLAFLIIISAYTDMMNGKVLE